MNIHCFLPLALLGAAPGLFGQTPQPAAGVPARRYQDGETLVYHMKATNEGRRYEVDARGVVKKDERGVWFEEYAWSNLVSNGAPFSLPASSQEFRQVLSLDVRKMPRLPNLSTVHPMLIGPVTDLMTFYVDLWLAERVANLSKAGNHLLFKHGVPSSWADGNKVIVAEDSIDFDITLTELDTVRQVGTLLIRHVPPKQPQIKLPAEWMREPVADTPNNWVEVARSDGKYVAAVGQETFDVRLSVSLADGRILSGSIENPVKTRERICEDAALTNCGEAHSHSILRQIEISLVH